MAVQRIDLNIRTVSMDSAAVDKLIRLGSGDAALLYLYLLRHQGEYDPARAGEALRWSRSSLDTAMARLQELGLAAGSAPLSEEIPLPKPEEEPEYTAADLTQALSEERGEFSQLVSAIESLTGRRLINSQLSILLSIYSHIALPSDVIFAMASFVYEGSREKYGPGAKLSMAQLRSTAYHWKEQGIDTLDAVDEYIKRCQLRKSREGAILSAMGIYGRKPTTSEARHIKQWLDWGFGPDMAARAADITVTNIGRLDWRYCNAVLNRWQKEGITTMAQLEAAQRQQSGAGQTSAAGRRRGAASRNGSPKDPRAQEQESRQNMLELQRFLAQMKDET